MKLLPKANLVWAIIGVAIVVVATTGAIAWWTERPTRMCKSLNRLDLEWKRKYYYGTFREATNALGRFIGFVESNKDKLPSYKDVDAYLYTAYVCFSYMLMCLDEVRPAYSSVNKAYEYYKRTRDRYFGEVLPRSQFVDFLISGVEQVDARQGARWRSDFKLNTNTVNRVRELFIDGEAGANVRKE